jgi:hypothetical protein
MRKYKQQANYQLFLTFMGFVNLLSMLIYLFNVEIPNEPGFKETVILIEALILSLNLLIGYYSLISALKPTSSISTFIKQLFFFTFLSICFYVSAFSIFGGEGSLLDVKNESFPIIFIFSSILFFVGSLYPMLISIKSLLGSKQLNKNLALILFFNGLNNFIGLYFYLLAFPTDKIALMLNIISNLVFSYFLSYHFLSEYYELRKIEKINQKKGTLYSWNELKNHLAYWEELKDFLEESYPELILKTESLPISNLEKIHFVLKSLQIKTKDVADAMNVSVKAVEMSRYRINKKINSILTIKSN